MTELDGYTFYDSGFIYTNRPEWKHTARGSRARNNLIFVTDGILYFEEDGIQYTVKTGECLLLEAGKTGKGYRPSGEVTSFFYALFEAPNPTAQIPKQFAVSNPDIIRRLFSQLIQCTGRYHFPAYAMDTLLKTLFYELMFQSEAGSDRRFLLTEDIKNWIYKQKYRNTTVAEIAAYFHFCPDHLAKLFKKYEQISLKDYLCSVKLSTINNMLSEPTFRIKRIAELTGFPNESSMCKFYKYHTGMTPSEYRTKYFNGEQCKKTTPQLPELQPKA